MRLKLQVRSFVFLCNLVTALISLYEGGTLSEQSLSPLNTSGSTLSFICPEQFGYFDDKSDCTKYFVCVFGEALHESCTGGLYFSAELQTCDWPRNVLCNKVNQTDGLTKENDKLDVIYEDPLEIEQPDLTIPKRSGQGNEHKDKEAENLDLQRSRSTLKKNFASQNNQGSTDFNYIDYTRNSAPIGRSVSGVDPNNVADSNNDSLTHPVSNNDVEPPQPSYDESYSSVVDSNGGIYLADGRGGLITVSGQLPGVLNLGDSEEDSASSERSHKRDQARPKEERLTDSRFAINKHSRNVDRRKNVPHYQLQRFQQQQHFKRMQQPPHTPVLNLNKNQDQEAKLIEGSSGETKRQDLEMMSFEEFSSLVGNSEIIVLPVVKDDTASAQSLPRSRTWSPQPNLQYNPSFVKYMGADESIFFDDDKSDHYNQPVSPRPKQFVISRTSPPRAAVRSRYPLVSRVNHQRHFRPFIPPYSGFEERRINEPIVYRHRPAEPNDHIKPIEETFVEEIDNVDEHANTPPFTPITAPPRQNERSRPLRPSSNRSNNLKNRTFVDSSNFKLVDNKPLVDGRNTNPGYQPSRERVVIFQNHPQVFSQINRNRSHTLTNHERPRHQNSEIKPVRNSGVPSEHGQPFGLVDYDDAFSSNSKKVLSSSKPTQRPTTVLTEHHTVSRGHSLSSYSTTPLPVETRTSRKPRPNDKRTSKLKTNHTLGPPSRPLNLYTTPVPLESATKCMPRNCLLPDCNCGSAQIPGGLNRNQVPQIVMITFDDAVNDLNWDIYEDIFNSKRKNPNQCPLLGTFYVSHEWTDYGQVQTLYSRGHEMASHGITHSFGEKFSNTQWHKEIQGQREILHLYGGVKLEDVRGMRAPFLQIGGNKMFEMLYNDNFTYDSSMPVFDNKPPFWPYTLDYAINHECMIAPCPSQSFPGIWEVGMVMWEDLKGGRCSMGDACSNPTDENGVYTMLLKNFKRHYNSNRAPFGLFYHSAWFNTPHHRKGFIKFIDEILGYGDVYFTTKWQMLQWVRNPTPLSSLANFEPWDCKKLVKQRSAPCAHPTVCNVRGKNGHRYMKTCQSCPNFYPWLGKTGI